MGAKSEAKDAAFEEVTRLWIAIASPFTADGAGLVGVRCLAEDLA